MKRGQRGQAVLIGIFVVLLLVLALSFYFYYFGVPEVTGEVVGERNVALVMKENIADNLLVPKSLEVNAVIDEDNRENFDVVNYNDKIVNVGCTFLPFQEEVPSSSCFTYDREGKFVGSGAVSILPGNTQTFTASVRPFDNVRIKRGSVETLINIREGEYHGEIELQAWPEEDSEKRVSIITIPVKIVVSK
ncbi:hypothetical protein J4233_00275 [Candidatus Pacearchaeota archaeon]|nr:hypothetical protein [Candidatus Pacearchaeota archaeon]